MDVREPNSDPDSDVCILLVDDDREVLSTIAATLRTLGPELVLARSGAEALERAAEREFAVIMLDVQMPVMDGFEAANRIRRLDSNRNTPIIFLTGVANSLQKKAQGYSMGAVDYMIKPFDVLALRSKIAVFVDLFVKFRRLKREMEALKQQHEDTLAAADSPTFSVEQMLRRENLADLSHELRTPLNSIVGFAELMYDSPVPLTPDRSKEYLGYILSSSMHLLRLVERVMQEAERNPARSLSRTDG